MYEQIYGSESSNSTLNVYPVLPSGEMNTLKQSWLPVESHLLPWVKCEEANIKEELNSGDEDSREKFCMLCSASNMSLSELKEHLASHTFEDPLAVCEDSSENIIYPKFSTFSHITYRDKKIGSNAKVYSCTWCGQYTIYLSDVAKHVNKECSRLQIVLEPTSIINPSSKQSMDSITCDECHRKYLDQNDYVRHLRIHVSKARAKLPCVSVGIGDSQTGCYTDNGGSKLTCNICFQTYKDPKVWEKHVISHQKKYDYKFICVTCGKIYVMLSSLETHMACHAVEPAECNCCGKIFKNGVMLKTHMMLHTKEYPFPCNVCDNKFILETSLIKHVEQAHKVHEKNFPCKYCGKVLTSKLRLRIHQDGHLNKGPRQPASHLCSACGKCFSWKSNLTTHERLVHRKDIKVHICSVCGKMFRTVTALRYHMANHEGIEEFICDVCGLGFCTPRNLRIHKFCHSDLRPFACKFCDSTFKHHRNLQHHRKSVHGVTPKGGKARITYPCNVCNKKFASLEFQMDHMRTHNNEQPFQCKVCEKKFAHYQGLFQHLRTGHTQVPTEVDHQVKVEKPIQCPQCVENFETKTALTEHKIVKHGNSSDDIPLPKQMREPIVCRHCGRPFVSSKSFIDHTRSEHGSTGEYLFACKHPQCNKSYKNLVGLRQHEYKQHSGIQRKMYPCMICKKTFTTKIGRDFHIDIHTGRRSFTCERCGKSFRLKSSLVEHALTHTDLMPVTCNVCNKHFRKRSHLITHMRTHTGEKPYTCDICGRAFAQAGDRNKHRINMHRYMQGASGSL